MTDEEIRGPGDWVFAAGRAPETPEASWLPSAQEYYEGALAVARERVARLTAVEQEEGSDGTDTEL
jgi:hypothetical protein